MLSATVHSNPCTMYVFVHEMCYMVNKAARSNDACAQLEHHDHA